MTDTITIPLATVQQALVTLEDVNPSLVCEMAHHPKKDQHGIGQKCPLEIRHLETIAALKAALEQQPVQEDSCFCHSGVSLQSVSGGAAPEGYLGKVTLLIDGEYVDYVKAQPPLPAQEQQQARVDVITVTLMREGINKHRARELADHFVNFTLTPPLPVQEPVAWLCCVPGQDAILLFDEPSDERYPPKYKDPLYTTPPLPVQEPVSMRMPKVGDKVICLEDESLGEVVSLTAGGSPDIKFDDGSHGTYLLREFAELFGYVTSPLPVQPEPVTWDKPSASFNEWWNGDYEDPANPFEKDSHGYWAWAGWQAALQSKNT